MVLVKHFRCFLETVLCFILCSFKLSLNILSFIYYNPILIQIKARNIFIYCAYEFTPYFLNKERLSTALVFCSMQRDRESSSPNIYECR